MSIRDEFMIERGGRQYVLFSGLLDEAHNRGLKGIDTELLQVPAEDNGNVAICKATVELEDGRTFGGIGDASPENVGRNIVPHLIRMAETRSKARALRDAVNVGVTALEELSDGEESANPTRTPNQPRSGSQTGKSSGQRQNKSSKPASDSQKNYLRRLAGDNVAEFEERHKPIDQLTVSEASAAIDALQGGGE